MQAPVWPKYAVSIFSSWAMLTMSPWFLFSIEILFNISSLTHLLNPSWMKNLEKNSFLPFYLRRLGLSSVHFISVTRSWLTCDPMNCSMPGLPVHHQLQESTQTHVHWIGNTIQPSHPLSSPSPPALHLSQHQGLFKWVCFLHQVAKVLEFQLQHHSFQWTPRADLL